jgi:hypothetical protein
MRNILNDDAVRGRVIRIAFGTVAGVGLIGGLLFALEPGGLRTLSLLALIAVVAGGGAAMGMTVQQHLLGRDVALRPLAVARWSGALITAVLGPLVTAGAALGVVAGLGMLLLPAENAGSYAGAGAAWLLLPMALLVTGTASLRTVDVALGRAREIRAVIDVAEGHEWSLVPVGIALALAVLLCTAGVAGLGLGVAPAAVAIVVGLALLIPASAALARHAERLGVG